MVFATDPTSMITMIDQSIATIVAGMISESSVNQRQAKLLELDQLRRTRREYVMLRNQTQPPILADVSDGPGQGANTTNGQARGPTQ
jgi:microcystin degradation protein MlrC